MKIVGVWVVGLALALGLSACGSSVTGSASTPSSSPPPPVRATTPRPGQVLGSGAGHAFYEISEPLGPPKGTMILIHGGGWTDREPYDAQFANNGGVRFIELLGWRVVNIGYQVPASIANPGAAPNAMPTLDDVAAFYDQIHRAFSGPICAYGSSSGGHLAMMLAVVRPDLDCVIAEAAPVDFAIARTAYHGYLEGIFGGSDAAMAYWSPVDRWKAAAPKTAAWLGEAANDPVVPREAYTFKQVDPNAQVTVLPGPTGPSSAPFVHSSVDDGAHKTYLAKLSNWLASIGATSMPRTTQAGPVIRACDDALPTAIDWAQASSSQRWRLLDDGAGWTAAAAPYGEVTATRGCDGRGVDQWAGLALQALTLSTTAPTISPGQAAEQDFAAPSGRTLVRVRARFRGWFRTLGEWQVGLFASSSTTGPIDTPVAVCDKGSCHGLSTWPSGAGVGMAPAATGRDPDTVDNLPGQTFSLPGGTVRIAWRLACVASTGCNGASINPNGDPASTSPTRSRDPVGHPAALTITAISVRVAG